MPCKISCDPSFSVDEFRGISLDVPYEIRDWKIRSDAYQNMDVVRHGVDLNQLLFPVRDDAGDVFVEFSFVLFGDKRLSSFDGKYNVYVELAIGVCHRSILLTFHGIYYGISIDQGSDEMRSNSRGLVDLLVGDVGVKFPVEVVVFAVHLVTEVVDSRIYIRIDLAEPCIHIGIQIAEALIHVGAKIVYTLIKTVYPLVKTADSLVQDRRFARSYGR